MIPVNRPLISEVDKKSVGAALERTYISGETPPIGELENKLGNYLGIRNVIAVSSGTTAIDLTIEALEFKPGDHVVLPAFTIISTVSNLLRKNVRVTLIDSDKLTWSMNVDEAIAALEPKTKLVLPVHIYGLPVDMDPLINSVDPDTTFILEDSAEALGLKYKGRQVGALGDASIFSFFANKIVTGGEGGAIATNSDEIASRVRSMRNLCFNQKERFVHSELGWNARMPALSGALISSQIDRLPSLIQQKMQIGRKYTEGLAGHPWLTMAPERTDYSDNIYWVFGVILNESCHYDASQFQYALREMGIDTRRFFCPINLQPLAPKFNISSISNLSVAKNLWDRGIYLPSGLGNTSNEIDQVIDTVWKLVK